VAERGDQGLAKAKEQPFDAVITDLKMPGLSGLELVEQLHATKPRLPIIVVTAFGTTETAIEATKLGAYDYLLKPFDMAELLDLVAKAAACNRLMSEPVEMGEARPNQSAIIGNSRAMQAVYKEIGRVAGTAVTVLIRGETGTGKELVARAIYQHSSRAAQPFIAVTCAAIPETLLESELFGHERGAFTGASQSRRGRFEEANGGTIFIDEIGDLALPLQAKLLRALQERTVSRLGSNVSHPIDVRVICATNRNLEQMVRDGTFREDLFFRISVVKIAMPSLREHVEDVPLLAEYFLRTFAKLHKKQCRSMTPGFLGALSRHSWPGNVRELQNVIERSVVLGNGHDRLGIDDLPPELRGLSISDELPKGSFQEALRGFKRELVRAALATHNGNKLKAAKELGISRCYLHRLLNQLEVPEAPGEELELQEAEELPVTALMREGPPKTVDPVRVFRSAARIA